ncbi:STE20/SPS1-related proline-alanine-rich protein kinase [Sarcoptes scabiei]|nr:STE20/SPS1-related proline-alanine-rich protein kinase [Sarcoptes scabiei]
MSNNSLVKNSNNRLFGKPIDINCGNQDNLLCESAQIDRLKTSLQSDSLQLNNENYGIESDRTRSKEISKSKMEIACEDRKSMKKDVNLSVRCKSKIEKKRNKRKKSICFDRKKSIENKSHSSEVIENIQEQQRLKLTSENSFDIIALLTTPKLDDDCEKAITYYYLQLKTKVKAIEELSEKNQSLQKKIDRLNCKIKELEEI